MATTRITAPSLEHLADPVFRTTFRGDVIAPGDTAYDEARKVYNGMIDRHPGLILRCNDAADVMVAVGLAREHGTLVSVRGGGHNAGGLGVCEGGIVIDLSGMRGVHVDQRSGTVLVAGGATWGDVDHATHPFDLAVPSGTVSTTGVAGLTLGGGIGHLSRRHGLTIDNLLAADVVLADGTLVTASPDEHADLFWALRGGGGNFGVVTSFLFQGQPVGTVIGGPMFWDPAHAPDVMRLWDRTLREAPDDLTGFFAFLNVPPAEPFPEHLHGRTVCGIVWCWTGAPDEADAALAPFRALGPPVFELVGPLPFPVLQSLFDPLLPPGLQWYWKADFLDEIDDGAMAAIIEHGTSLPSGLSTTHIYPISGAAGRVADDATAFTYRGSRYAAVIVGIDPDPAMAPAITEWTRGFYDALHPFGAGGAYVNFLQGDEGEDRVQATYGANYERLREVKRRYDPDNLFRVNQNIAP